MARLLAPSASVETLCEAPLRCAKCTAVPCPNLHPHTTLPYLWQIHVDSLWLNLSPVNEAIEAAFCVHDNATFQVQTVIEMQAAGSLVAYTARLEISFTQPYTAAAEISQSDNPANRFTGMVDVRRLSTPSYVHFPEEGQYFSTVWTWCWKDGHTWKTFGVDSPIPSQSVLELKYLHGQEMYRFEYEEERNILSDPTVFLLDFRHFTMSNLSTQTIWHLRRRPAFVNTTHVQAGQCPSPHARKQTPFSCSYPLNWTPVDPQFDYEIVPLNPTNMEYHLVASEVTSSLRDRTIEDIYRIQNPYLWHKFDSKRKQFQTKGRNANEQQLFHGTSDDKVVSAIFRQNFDWRVAGKNATIFGKGAYFAKDASYSDRYTGPEQQETMRFLFMARVLVGAYTVGSRDITRPPPRDPNKPYGDLYDSCVNEDSKPKIFVLFDTDQYYPEYVINYKREVDNPFEKT